jgi:hypothetical protein
MIVYVLFGLPFKQDLTNSEVCLDYFLQYPMQYLDSCYLVIGAQGAECIR